MNELGRLQSMHLKYYHLIKLVICYSFDTNETASPGETQQHLGWLLGKTTLLAKEPGIFTNQSFRKAAILFTVKTMQDLVKSHRKARESRGTLELVL